MNTVAVGRSRNHHSHQSDRFQDLSQMANPFGRSPSRTCIHIEHGVLGIVLEPDANQEFFALPQLAHLTERDWVNPCLPLVALAVSLGDCFVAAIKYLREPSDKTVVVQ